MVPNNMVALTPNVQAVPAPASYFKPAINPMKQPQPAFNINPGMFNPAPNPMVQQQPTPQMSGYFRPPVNPMANRVGVTVNAGGGLAARPGTLNTGIGAANTGFGSGIGAVNTGGGFSARLNAASNAASSAASNFGASASNGFGAAFNNLRRF